MKKILLTVLAFSFIGTSIFGQDLSSSVSTSKNALNAAASALDALTAKVKAMRDVANQEFNAEQAEIDATKASLAAKRAEIESKNADEPNMLADVWPARVAAREQLVRDENSVAYKQQILSLKKSDFERRMKQTEAHIITTFAKQIADFNKLYEGNMSSFLGKLE